MKLLVNGEEKEVEGKVLVSSLVKQLGFTEESVAVACDGKFVSRRHWTTITIEGSEQIEILSAMEGG